MVVTLTVAQAAADRLLGDGVTNPPEPTLGTLTRYLSAAAAIVESYAPDAPVGVQNTAASLVVGYLYDAPVGDSTRFANSLANSGAQALLSRWQSQRVAIVGGDGGATVGVSGLTRVGSETVNVVARAQWVGTTLSVPTAAVIGVELIYPNGSTSSIDLFPNTLTTDAPVTPGDTTTPLSEYSIGRTAQNMIALASSMTGRHTLTIWTVG